jgi:hypothetical protein
VRNGPVQILDAVPADDATTVRLADGREFLDVNMALEAEDVERIRAGYVCIRCLEPQLENGLPVPFPERCLSVLPNGQRWCNFPMRAKQAEEFAIMFKGTVKIGSSINYADELERIQEFDEYEKRTGMVIPAHIRNKSGPI